MTRTLVVVASVLIVAVAVMTAGTTATNAQTNEDIPALLERIAELENLVAAKHAVAMEQARVMLDMLEMIPKEYGDYSMQMFPDTGGYDPAWIEDNRDIIMQACTDTQADGFDGLNFCQYVN